MRESKNICKFLQLSLGENSFVAPTRLTLNALTILDILGSASYLTHFVFCTTVFK